MSRSRRSNDVTLGSGDRPRSVGMLSRVPGTPHGVSTRSYSERDLAVAKIDTNRRWPSTVDSTQDVPEWQEIWDDPEVLEAFQEVGLA